MNDLLMDISCDSISQITEGSELIITGKMNREFWLHID